MITNLLTKINKELEELNYQLRDNDYLNDLENKINIINESINMEHQQNIKLHSIIKEVREYIENYNIGMPYDHFVKKENLLEILDKENKNEVVSLEELESYEPQNEYDAMEQDYLWKD